MSSQTSQALPPFIRPAAPSGSADTILELLIQPRASKTSLVGEHDGRLKIRLAAPPVDGAANEALIRFLSDKLGVPRSSVSIMSGETGRRKTVRITALPWDSVLSKLGVSQ